MLGGYAGKILRVDLSSGQITEEQLPEEKVLKQYLGGTGLGLKILLDEVDETVAPYDAENRVIFMTGPLTATPVPGSNNLSMISINADVPKAVGTSHTHGYLGPNLKWAGYDGIIVQGVSEKPVYLWIHDGQAEIRDAGKFWGKDTHDTEDLVKKDIGEQRASVATIGPAGENLIAGACVQNDKHHTCAHGGMGSIMGSKKLKAVAVFGRKPVPISHPKKLLELAERWRSPEFVSWMGGGVTHQGGMTRCWNLLGMGGILAGKNLSSAEFGRELGAKFVEECKKFKIVPKACFGCPVACAYKAYITCGPHKGEVFTLAGGGENLEGAAAMMGATNAGDVLWMTERYDRLGIGTSTMGCTVALAVECYERGIINKEDTGGLELNWGNAEAASKLLDKIVAREGIGKILAEGPKKAAEAIGGDAPKIVVHMKGVGFNLHDWRGKWQSFLGQAVAGAGPRWEGIGMDAFGFEPDLGYNAVPEPFKIEGAAEVIKKSQAKKLFEDSLGICWFMAQGGMTGILSLEAQAVSATTGMEGVDGEHLMTVGERIANMERVFNVSRGLTLEDDLDVGARMLEPPVDGPAKGKTVAPYFKEAVLEYYRLMGWEENTGKPLPETLKRLGLQHLIKKLG
ncbi:MAG: aldehyde ferredoxin oxidoreductase C-terminal domain-containing protein [Dehalococcoidia bacterium]|nr:aldehyde ferredoxin oxidoreductase C-terminal domain-containing protein [Dehalococcoidia bacterium]